MKSDPSSGLSGIQYSILTVEASLIPKLPEKYITLR